MNASLGSAVMLLLSRRWPWLLGGAAAATALAALILLRQPLEFTTTVNVIPKRARTEVNYDTRIRTVYEGGGFNGQAVSSLVGASAERRQALAQLVRSAGLERAARERLGAALPPELHVPGRLAQLIRGRVVPRSEVIAIEVRAPTPQLAEEIGLAWAYVYERHVNDLYATSSSGVPLLDGELQEARRKYQASEDALTSFVASSPLAELRRQLSSKQSLLNELGSVRLAQVVDLVKIAHRVDLLTGQAEALQEHLATAQDNSAAATGASALVLLKTQAFASSLSLPSSLQLQSFVNQPMQPAQPGPSGAGQTPSASGGSQSAPDQAAELSVTSRSLQDWSLPANLQMQMPAAATTATLAQQRADVAATIYALKEWRGRLDQEVERRSAETPAIGTDSRGPSADVTPTIERLEAETRELQGKIAEQSARQRTLQQERDLLWESFSGVLRKAEEDHVASLVSAGNEVSIAGQSVPEPRPRGMAVVLPIAALLGAVTAAGLFLLRDYVAPRYSAALAAAQSNGHPASSGPDAALHPVATGPRS